MIKYECKTCGGVYLDSEPDGLLYYHACPQKLDKDNNFIEFKDKRDENIKTKLEGLGRTKIE